MAEAGPHRKRRRWLFWALGAIVAVILAPFVITFAYYGLATIFAGCSDAERAAITEFSQYGGITAEPDGDVEGGCRMDLAVDDPPADVIAYYRQQLKEHGWTIDDSEQRQGETVEGQGSFESGGLSAHRDGLFWNVQYEAQQGRTITLVVHVSEA